MRFDISVKELFYHNDFEDHTKPPILYNVYFYAQFSTNSKRGRKTLYLIQPDPSGFKPLASAEMLGEGTNWGPMALNDGKLLVRYQSQLKCLKVVK